MKREIVEQYNVINTSVDKYCPLSVGNGHFVFTCDVTGLQTLKNDYDVIPLLSMSEKFAYKIEDSSLGLKPYNAHNRIVYYMTDRNLNPKAYDSLRTNYFKYNMFNLAFFYQGQKLKKEEISNIFQTLDLFTATLYSNFQIFGEQVKVITKVESSKDILNLEINSSLLTKGLELRLEVRTASYNKNGFEDYFNGSLIYDNDILIIKDDYRQDNIKIITNALVESKSDYVLFKATDNKLILRLDINNRPNKLTSVSDFFLKARTYLSGNKEIDRRIILSLYLIRINSCGDYPPAETGLTCNSWYGKFHLEMHLWHHLGLIYYGCYKEVLPSLDYYFTIYKEARKRASLNGFKGVRWPKMTDPSGLDSPSNIGCLLFWQQAHLVYMLFEIKRLNNNFNLKKYDILIKDSLACIASFFYKEDEIYYLDYPIIPAQECYDVLETRSPIFEIEYFRYIFILARQYAYTTPLMEDIINKAIRPKVYDNAYEGHINTNKTYTKYNFDHPLPIMAFSFFKGDRLDNKIMANSLNKVLTSWDFSSMWGWDFPSIALCYYNLGYKKEAKSFLLADYAKNTYLKNGHNMQRGSDALPVYLPGNGAFLIACYKIFSNN